MSARGRNQHPKIRFPRQISWTIRLELWLGAGAQASLKFQLFGRSDDFKRMQHSGLRNVIP